MLSRLRHALIRAALRTSAPATGRRVVGDYDADDIFIVGFPRSGHTWCQYLIAGLTCGVDVSRCPDGVVQEIVPDLDSILAYGRHTKPVFLKTHALPAPPFRRVIYLLRDGRDAMVSYFHYYNDRVAKIDFATLVRDAPGLNARWHEHVDAWTANPHRAELLVVKYEDLRAEPLRELRRIADFAGVKADDAAFAAAVENAGFERQQKREKTMGWADAGWPRDKPFVRRGVVGGFRDEMPKEALDAFLDGARSTLARNGYEV